MSGRPAGASVRFALMGRAGFAAHQNRPRIRPNETREARLIVPVQRPRNVVRCNRLLGLFLRMRLSMFWSSSPEIASRTFPIVRHHSLFHLFKQHSRLPC